MALTPSKLNGFKNVGQKSPFLLFPFCLKREMLKYWEFHFFNSAMNGLAYTCMFSTVPAGWI